MTRMDYKCKSCGNMFNVFDTTSDGDKKCPFCGKTWNTNLNLLYGNSTFSTSTSDIDITLTEGEQEQESGFFRQR